MPEYYSPGVYVEEVDSGSRPIQGVGTAVAAFIGLAESGPFNTPTLVSNWLQFSSLFGGFVDGSYLAHSVHGYFVNGGGNCYIVRIGDEEAAASETAPVAPQAMLRGFRVQALESGVGDGEITVEVAEAGGDSPSEEMFKLLVKRGGQVVEEYDRATVGRGRQNLAAMVRDASKVIGIETAGAAEKPEVGEVATLVTPPSPEALPSPRLSADDYVGDVDGTQRSAGPRGHRRHHHGVHPRPDERLPAERHQPRDGAGRAARDDRALRTDGRPHRDPGRAARPERPAGQGMAPGQGRL